MSNAAGVLSQSNFGGPKGVSPHLTGTGHESPTSVMGYKDEKENKSPGSVSPQRVGAAKSPPWNSTQETTVMHMENGSISPRAIAPATGSVSPQRVGAAKSSPWTLTQETTITDMEKGRLSPRSIAPAPGSVSPKAKEKEAEQCPLTPTKRTSHKADSPHKTPGSVAVNDFVHECENMSSQKMLKSILNLLTSYIAVIDWPKVCLGVDVLARHSWVKDVPPSLKETQESAGKGKCSLSKISQKVEDNKLITLDDLKNDDGSKLLKRIKDSFREPYKKDLNKEGFEFTLNHKISKKQWLTIILNLEKRMEDLEGAFDKELKERKSATVSYFMFKVFYEKGLTDFIDKLRLNAQNIIARHKGVDRESVRVAASVLLYQIIITAPINLKASYPGVAYNPGTKPDLTLTREWVLEQVRRGRKITVIQHDLNTRNGKLESVISRLREIKKPIEGSELKKHDSLTKEKIKLEQDILELIKKQDECLKYILSEFTVQPTLDDGAGNLYEHDTQVEICESAGFAVPPPRDDELSEKEKQLKISDLGELGPPPPPLEISDLDETLLRRKLVFND